MKKGGEKMGRNNTVVLACGEELADEVNLGVLESAGFLVIKTSYLDYALAANELFDPTAIVLDIDQANGEIENFCRALIERNRYPLIYVLGDEEKAKVCRSLLFTKSEYLKKPLSAFDLTARIIKDANTSF
jgi:DNA-binding response OmpR family regulator